MNMNIRIIFYLIVVKMAHFKCPLKSEKKKYFEKLEKLHNDRKSDSTIEPLRNNSINHYFDYCSCNNTKNPSKFCSNVFKTYYENVPEASSRGKREAKNIVEDAQSKFILDMVEHIGVRSVAVVCEQCEDVSRNLLKHVSSQNIDFVFVNNEMNHSKSTTFFNQVYTIKAFKI